MNNAITFSAFDSDGVAVQLSDVLRLIPTNNLIWSLLEFRGTGNPPSGMTMDEFEDLVIRTPGGIRFSWKDLLEFANGIDQTTDCLLVGAKVDYVFPEELKEGSNVAECEFLIGAFDSAEWSIIARDATLKRKLRNRFAIRAANKAH